MKNKNKMTMEDWLSVIGGVGQAKRKSLKNYEAACKEATWTCYLNMYI